MLLLRCSKVTCCVSQAVGTRNEPLSIVASVHVHVNGSLKALRTIKKRFRYCLVYAAEKVGYVD